MGYSELEAREIDDLTREEVIAELDNHQADPEIFFKECGECDFYTGEAVLNWLGY